LIRSVRDGGRFSSQQAASRRLDKAFQAFFQRVKAGEKPDCPRFRGAMWFDTVDFPKDGDGPPTADRSECDPVWERSQKQSSAHWLVRVGPCGGLLWRPHPIPRRSSP
jgi:hypothetical protein